ncbi:hypothetical protein BGX34_003956 [Mortierella sp. NVP85]|nr:hypothetical protein BGX34_003956 [Mortierella sp. NVP85]
MSAAGVISVEPVLSIMSWPSALPPLTPPSTPPQDLSLDAALSMKCNEALAIGGGVQFQPIQEHQEPPIQSTPSPACLAKIVTRCKNLQKLRLHGGMEGVHYDMIEAIVSLKYLQSLELYADKVVIDQEDSTTTTRTRLLNVQDLISQLPQLETLALRGTAFSLKASPSKAVLDRHVDTEESDNGINSSAILVQGSCAVRPSPVQFALKQDGTTTLVASPFKCPKSNLNVDNPSPPLESSSKHLSLDMALQEEELSLLLQQCPLLESLDLPGGLAWEWSDDFIRQVAQSCSRLSGFSINSSCHAPVSEERLTALVLALPPLRRFGIRSCFLGDSTLDALEERSPELEILDISLSKTQHLSKARFYDYLRNAAKLREVEAEGVWIWLKFLEDNSDGLGQQQQHIQVDQQRHLQPRHGWANRHTLQRLTLGFTSPDRSTQNCYPMYNLLSTFTELEYLHLSYTCLRFSRESGFHQLETLTRLRTFGIETCAYTPLTREDVVWMVTTWPQLERIYLNLLGASRERLIRQWLKELHREDIVIESQVAISY